jgi:putative ABC transport system ATP-binding protein
VTSTPYVFTTQKLCKTYGTGESVVHALRDVDIKIPQGELIVLLGASGSGKSTFLNILGGLDSATSGTASFLDHALTAMNEHALTQYRRQHVGFVFQFYNLMPSLTAYENVELVTEIAANPFTPDEALSLVGLEHRLHHYPSQLSGGEQQRVAIARAIAKKPSVLFCDEPTGALDSNTGRAVLRVLQDINEQLNTTVIIITHATATAEMADRVIHFLDGTIKQVIVNKNKKSAENIVW